MDGNGRSLYLFSSQGPGRPMRTGIRQGVAMIDGRFGSRFLAKSGGAASWVLIAGLLLPAPARAQTEPRAIVAAQFQAQLEEIARAATGVVGAHAIDLTTGETFGVNDALVFPQASSIKIPILLELYRRASAGEGRLEQRLAVRAADQVGGSGVIGRFGDGTSELSARDLAILMIVLSDNTATNMLIDHVGMAAVNRTLAALGTRQTRLQRKMQRPEESARGNENISTAAEAAAIMARIARCELPLSAELCADLRAILEIPKDAPVPFTDPIPSSVRVAWKPGWITGVQAAWGIVALPGRPYVLTVMVSYSDEAGAPSAVRAVADAAYSHFSRLAGVTPYGTRVPPSVLEAVSGRRPPPR
ncbi:MAG: serine hydrolase [Gemmatimonadetes bacterium]|nr:serine hydrolase [Gemmatimonadota bacterium]